MALLSMWPVGGGVVGVLDAGGLNELFVVLVFGRVIIPAFGEGLAYAAQHVFLLVSRLDYSMHE